MLGKYYIDHQEYLTIKSSGIQLPTSKSLKKGRKKRSYNYELLDDIFSTTSETKSCYRVSVQMLTLRSLPLMELWSSFHCLLYSISPILGAVSCFIIL